MLPESNKGLSRNLFLLEETVYNSMVLLEQLGGGIEFALQTPGEFEGGNYSIILWTPFQSSRIIVSRWLKILMETSRTFTRKDKSLLSGMVHIRMEVHKMDSEMSRLVEQPWLQLMCCAVCLPCGHNFK